MLSASKKTFCAVEAVLYIAYNSGHGAISSRDIATRQGLPSRYLEGLMQKLVRGGILRGLRGPSGGYVLAKERRRISVADIITIIGNDEDDAGEKNATKLGEQVVRPLWQRAEAQLLDYLKQVNLTQLCEQAESKKIKRTADEKLDFAI